MHERGWALACALLVAAYAALVFVHADNLPKLDDLNDAFGFFAAYHQADNTLGRLHSFFYPNNEHVTLFNHLIYWLQWRCFGELNFQHLIWLGNGLVIGTALLANRLLQPMPGYLSFVLLSGYLSLLYWDSSFKAMTALSNQGVIFFAAASLLAAARQRWRLAIVLAICCHFSQLNGVLIWPLLALTATLSTKNQRLRWTLTIIATALASLALYHFASQGFRHNNQTGADLWQNWAAHPLLPLHAFINFIGAGWLPSEWPQLSSAIGIAALCMLGWLLYRQPLLWRQQPALLLFIAFLLLSAASAALTRALAYQDHQLILGAARYRMYSMLFLLMLLCLWLRHPAAPLQTLSRASGTTPPAAKKPQWGLATLGLALFCYSAWFALPSIHTQTQTARNSLIYWLVDGDFRRQEIFHILQGDFFYFSAEYLGVWNPYHAAQLPTLHFSRSALACDDFAPDTLPYCPFHALHRREGIAAQIITPQLLPSGSQLLLCSASQPAFVSNAVSERDRQAPRLLLARARLSHDYSQFILLQQDRALCRQALSWHPRSRETEMQQNFATDR